ncbi:hypothetical protein [Novosphingobium aureum]|nr:hypothetical protein [Novosphingobium aureum]
MPATKPLAMLALAIATPLAATACTQGKPAEKPPASPAARAIGEPLSCLSLSRFSNTHVRDDWTIDFIGSAGNKVWRVTLPRRCTGLRSADTFTYATSLTQLCQQDVIYPLTRVGNSLQRSGACGLAPFVPVELER